MSEDTSDEGWIHWPTMAKSAAVGIGLGMIYGVATDQFVFGIILGFVTGIGFAVGRMYSR